MAHVKAPGFNWFDFFLHSKADDFIRLEWICLKLLLLHHKCIHVFQTMSHQQRTHAKILSFWWCNFPLTGLQGKILRKTYPTSGRTFIRIEKLIKYHSQIKRVKIDTSVMQLQDSRRRKNAKAGTEFPIIAECFSIGTFHCTWKLGVFCSAASYQILLIGWMESCPSGGMMLTSRCIH